MLAWMEALKQAKFARLELPMPPSVNKYWRVGERGQRGKFLTSEAKRFRVDVQALALINQFPRFTGPVVAVLEFHQTGKMCDLDNYEKALWDAIQSASILVNDCQIVCVLRYWGSVRKTRGISLSMADLQDLELLNSVPAWSHQVESLAAGKRSGDGKPNRTTKRRDRAKGSGPTRRNKYAAHGEADNQ
jgi:crossover junction endodeoxyribonuclease RusA